MGNKMHISCDLKNLDKVKEVAEYLGNLVHRLYVTERPDACPDAPVDTWTAERDGVAIAVAWPRSEANLKLLADHLYDLIDKKLGAMRRHLTVSSGGRTIEEEKENPSYFIGELKVMETNEKIDHK